MSENNPNPNIEQARQVQSKFEFYVIALVFTVLGFSIQTADLNKHMIHAILEIIAWICLLVSGLAGLSRLHWIPLLIYQKEYLKVNQGDLKLLEKTKNSGMGVYNEMNSKTEPVEPLIESKENEIEKRNTVIKRISNKGDTKFKIHKWGFILGFGFLLLSRIFKGLSL